MKKHKMKKQFGQNFLSDPNLLKKIVNSAKIKSKDVIEIGPGQGALTKYLVLDAKSVLAYEIDTTLKPYLDEIEFKHDNLNIEYIDILSAQFPIDKEYHVVANIPYNITSPIIFKILEASNIKTATLMVQKEVCDRITAKENTKQYNGLSVIVQYYMDVEKIMNVKRHLFRPVPKVDSAVFRMVRKKDRLDKKLEEKFIEIVKASFSQKRKTIANNWVSSFDINKEEANKFLKKLNIDEMARAETISLKNYIKIVKNWPF